MLDFSLQLGRIYQHCDDLPPTEVRAEIKAKVRSILPAASEPAIKSKFTSAKRLTSGYEWAARIYSLVNHELRFRL